MHETSLLLFIVKVVVLFLLLLLLYYWASPYLLLFLAKGTESVLIELYPGFIESITLKNYQFEVVTFFEIANIKGAQLAFDINPLKYTYGFPLFVALTIASNSRWMDKLWYSLIAFFITLLFQIWGVGFDTIRHLLFEFNGAYAAYFDYADFTKNAISLASQLGFLIFPSLIPVILWGYFENQYVLTLVGVKK